MKKTLLFCSFVLLCSMSFAQSSFTANVLSPLCRAQKITTTDTGYLQAKLCTTDDFKSIVFGLLSGPNAPLISNYSTTYNTGKQAITYAQVTKTIPGTYVFSITGTSSTGNISTATDTLIVSLPPNPCPVIPPARTVVSFSFKLVSGAWVPSFIFSDGTSQ